MRVNLCLRATLTALLCCVAAASGSAAEKPASIELTTGWKLQSACAIHAAGDRISVPGYAATAEFSSWIDALVPGTVLGSQVHDGLFPDPYFGMNLRAIPGTDYPIGRVFGYLPMRAGSPYRCSWWYRTQFNMASDPGSFTTLHFDGINYRANIWLNGVKLAGSDDLAGAFRSYDLDISKDRSRTGSNVLAVQVFAQTENDLGIDFLDWNPAPADKSLGLWRPVSVQTTGPVSLAHPAVSTQFADDSLRAARLTIVADVTNHADHPTAARISATLGGFQLQQQVELAPREQKVVQFRPSQFIQLNWKDPPVWWPYQYGQPKLEKLRMTASVDGAVSDERTIRFGIREVQSFINPSGYEQFRINRRNILIRGGGWAPDLFYREPKERLRHELDYVRALGLNAIRLEGKLGSDDLFDMADQEGILVLAGWQCCDHWQKWDQWSAEDHAIAKASTYSQISRLRSHPSLLAWLNGSDEAPSAPAEREALDVVKERDWPNPVLSSAAERTSTLTGKSGVKMTGPYDYVPPEYWYLDRDRFGGAFGFNTETSPGPAILPEESIHRTLPKDKWWPINDAWNYHAGGHKFAQMTSFNAAMAATYGPTANLHSYTLKAQVMAYDGERAMYEAYSANKYRSTGVIQWMLNNAWPSFIWHLYDYYLVPGGGYFGTKKANEPVHIEYRYDDRRIAVVNSTLDREADLHAAARLLDLSGKEIFRKEVALDVEADGVFTGFPIPETGSTAFLQLQLRDHAGKLRSENFYWLPAKLAQLDWAKTTYVNTPAIGYANMQDLQSLPEAAIAARVVNPVGNATAIEVKNIGSAVAFFVQLRVVRAGTDEDIAPIFWSDNCISLLPGESRQLTVSDAPPSEEPSKTDATKRWEVKIDGWNVSPRTLRLTQ